MTGVSVPVDGIDTPIKSENINIQLIEFDQANPRISFYLDNQVTDKLTEDQIVFALTSKKPEAYRKLKDSIHNNRGIMNPVWLEPIQEYGGKKYRVIEGNTRVLIYSDLAREEPNEDRWKNIMASVLPKEVTEEQKNFIRLISHLRGSTEWDAYEKAKYLYRLWQDEGWSKARLEKQTKMTQKQIEENIKAFQIMEEQYLPQYTDPNEVSKFSYFVEYVKDKALQKEMKKNSLGIENFCDWVADKNKLPTGADVRRLKDIIENDEIREIFLVNDFTSAMQVLEFKKPYLVSSLYKDIEGVINGLKEISSKEIDEIVNEQNSEKEKMLKELTKWSQKVLTMVEDMKSVL